MTEEEYELEIKDLTEEIESRDTEITALRVTIEDLEDELADKEIDMTPIVNSLINNCATTYSAKELLFDLLRDNLEPSSYLDVITRLNMYGVK